jgi:hypothetical protein
MTQATAPDLAHMPSIDRDKLKSFREWIDSHEPEQIGLSTRSYYRYRAGDVPPIVEWMLSQPEAILALLKDAIRAEDAKKGDE